MLDKIITVSTLGQFLTNLKDYISTLFNNKQDTLISGSNIKTINGVSMLGSGNINVNTKPLVSTTDSNIELLPNTYYRKTNQSSSITITLAAETDSTILNEYLIEFTTATSGTTISLPSSIKWANGYPSFDVNSTYQISIVNNLGICIKFETTQGGHSGGNPN